MGHLARIFRAGFFGSLAATSVALLLALALAGPAGAKTCTKRIAPPGHAGSTEYSETVPTSCGNASPPSSGSSGSGSGITHLGHGTTGVHGLSKLGPSGQAAASLAAATAPQPVGSGGGSEPRGASGSAGSGPVNSGPDAPARASGLPASTGSESGTLGSALTGADGGLGILLPILMGVGLAAAIAAGVVRLRRSGGPSV